MIFIFIPLFLLCVRLLFNSLAKRKLCRSFVSDNVLVTGAKGSGKDLLFSYVVNRRGRRYHSNVNYGGLYVPFKPSTDFSVGGNTCQKLINEEVIPYDYPYGDNEDYYLSDGGVYFPSQEFSLLNKRYPSIPLFAALSRHLGDCRIHVNVQTVNRLWDKLREQCTLFIWVRHSLVLFHRIVRMSYVVYTDPDTCARRVLPFKAVFGGKEGRVAKEKLRLEFGDIEKHTIWFFLRHKYDDRAFKNILKGGPSNENT